MSMTKEDILRIANERRQQRTTEDTGVSRDARKIDRLNSQDVRFTGREYDENRRESDRERSAETSTDDRSSAIGEGNSRGYDGNVDPIDIRYRRSTTSDGSTNQRDSRVTDSTTESNVSTGSTGSTGSTEQPQYASPLKSKHGWFNKFSNAAKPYADAIRGEGKSQQKGDSKTSPKSKTKVLTETEAKAIRERLIEVILWESEQLDQFIIATTKGHDHSLVIWSDIDRDDAVTLADFMIDEGKRRPVIAGVVRNMLEVQRRVQVGLITIPRAVKTVATYMQRGISIY